MVIAEITRNGFAYFAHDTREDAVAYILAELGPDYTSGPAARFWPSEDGRYLMQSERSAPDFSARVHGSAGAALISLADMDEEALPIALRAIAAAIEAAA